MTLREALVTAVDFIVASGTEDRALIQAAKALERKAERLRARTEVSLMNLDVCDCGSRKPKPQNFCHDCYSVFPQLMFATWLRGTPKASARAWRQMRALSAARLREEAA
jgi:hypothetical protein